MPPGLVDADPITAMWLVRELVEHETDPERWWRNPVGFNLLAAADADPLDYSGPPPGYQNLPMHEGD